MSRAELHRAVVEAVLISRTYVKAVPHVNPWHYADDAVRDMVAEVLDELAVRRS